MVLITGASGLTGSSVLEEVLKAGGAPKAMYRDEASARSAPPQASAVVADFSNPASLEPAFRGVHTLFLVCGPIPQLVEYEKNAIDAAVDSGVRHLVLYSALGAGDYPISFPSWHRQVEEHLKSTSLAWTIFRPNAFMQNIVTYNSRSIKEQNAFYNSLGEARTSYVDVRDAAAAIASALLRPGAHTGQTYELNGPEALTEAEVAASISRAAGRTVTYIAITQQDQKKAMLGTGMPDWQVEAILGLQRYYLGGQGGEVTGVLEGLLGRAPNTVQHFVSEYKDRF